jgi:hypothetical protein
LSIIGIILDPEKWSSEGVTAAATLSIAVFTIVLVVVTNRQARLTKDALIYTQRAFVFVRNGQIAIGKDFKTDKVKNFKVSVTWENSGDTPTKNMRMMINRFVTPEPLPDDFDFPDYEIGDIHTLLGPKSTISSVPLEISTEEMRAVREDESHLYVWGWAEYGDVFPGTKRHRTEFCQKWWVGGDLINASKFSAGFTWYHQHNGADGECMKPLQTESEV